MKRRSRVQLTTKEFEVWRQQFFLTPRSERLGQAFVNDHRLDDQELFYEEDAKVAQQIIRDNYVRDLF